MGSGACLSGAILSVCIWLRAQPSRRGMWGEPVLADLGWVLGSFGSTAMEEPVLNMLSREGKNGKNQSCGPVILLLYIFTRLI